MNLSQKSIVELKAMAYDVIAMMENYQKNLVAINNEISRRAGASVEGDSDVHHD